MNILSKNYLKFLLHDLFQKNLNFLVFIFAQKDKSREQMDELYTKFVNMKSDELGEVSFLNSETEKEVANEDLGSLPLKSVNSLKKYDDLKIEDPDNYLIKVEESFNDPVSTQFGKPPLIAQKALVVYPCQHILSQSKSNKSLFLINKTQKIVNSVIAFIFKILQTNYPQNHCLLECRKLLIKTLKEKTYKEIFISKINDKNLLKIYLFLIESKLKFLEIILDIYIFMSNIKQNSQKNQNMEHFINQKLVVGISKKP